MKLNLHSHGLLLLLLVLVSSQWIHTTKASLNEGGAEVDTDGFKQLMGMEECDDGDDECLERRMISEAHLDYIYTQHQKSP